MDDNLNRKFNLPLDGSSFDKRQVPMKPNDDASSDHDYVRNNMYENIELATQALNDLYNLAQSSQHPRAYEVFATLFKNTNEANKEYLELHQKRKEFQKEEKETPTTVNNNLYVTTDTLAKMIEDASKKKED